MKILLVVPEYPPFHVGGGGEVFKNLAENYKKLGHDVVVIYGYYLSKSWTEKVKFFEKNGIRYYQIPEIPCSNKFSFLRTTLPPNINSFFSLDNIIKKENPDIAHLHGYGFVFINIMAKLLKKNGVNYILTLHGAPVSHDKKGNLIKIIYFFYKNYFGRYLLKNASTITAVSNFSKKFLEFKNFKNKIIVINNGINQELFYNSNINKNYFGNNLGEIIFLSLGRIEWLKGFQYFIKIMPLLKKDGYNIKYYIAGLDNGYKNELLKLIKKHNLMDDVIFLGQLDFLDKISAIQSSNYIIISSIVENFPAVPLEAILLKTIPIGNNQEGIKEIVKDNFVGYICNMDKEYQFYQKLKFILENQTNNEKIIKNFNNYINSYDWEVISKKYLKYLKKWN